MKELLTKLGACQEAITAAGDNNIEYLVANCHRGDWLLWLAQKLCLPLNKLILAKARCAKTVIHLMKDQKSIDAVNVAERFGLDECTFDELEFARKDAVYAAAAAAAYAADAVYADDAAVYADDAAVYAADAADAVATAYAAVYADDAVYADAIYAADAAAAAAATAAAATAAATAYATAAAVYAAYADAKKKNQMETADICREILGKLIIQTVNSKL